MRELQLLEVLEAHILLLDLLAQHGHFIAQLLLLLHLVLDVYHQLLALGLQGRQLVVLQVIYLSFKNLYRTVQLVQIFLPYIHQHGDRYLLTIFHYIARMENRALPHVQLIPRIVFSRKAQLRPSCIKLVF